MRFNGRILSAQLQRGILEVQRLSTLDLRFGEGIHLRSILAKTPTSPCLQNLKLACCTLTMQGCVGGIGSVYVFQQGDLRSSRTSGSTDPYHIRFEHAAGVLVVVLLAVFPYPGGSQKAPQTSVVLVPTKSRFSAARKSIEFHHPGC
jgi:hypothetical protein